jgi:hypothetical protein
MCEAQPLPAPVKSLEQLFHIDFTPPYDFDPIFATVRHQENIIGTVNNASESQMQFFRDMVTAFILSRLPDQYEAVRPVMFEHSSLERDTLLAKL